MGYRSLYFYAPRKSSKDGFPVRRKSSIHRQPSPPFAFHFPSPCCEWSIIRGNLPSIYCSIHTECTRGSIIARAGRSDFGSSSRIPTKDQANVFQRIDQLIPHILRLLYESQSCKERNAKSFGTPLPVLKSYNRHLHFNAAWHNLVQRVL